MILLKADKSKRMKTKDRRQSGRYCPRLVGKDNLNWLRENCLLPQEAWDDWKDHRDGLRFDRDRTHIRHPYMSCCDPKVIRKQNAKLLLLLLRRKEAKEKWKRNK